MAADGKVTIEVDLSTNHVQSDADQIEKILNDIDIPTIKVKADGTNAEKEVVDVEKLVQELPKEKLVQLKAQAEENGFKTVQEYLRSLPQEKVVEIIAKDNASRNLNGISNNTENARIHMSNLKDVMFGTFLGNLLADGMKRIINFLKEMTGQAIQSYDALTTFKSTMRFAGFDTSEIKKSTEDLKEYSKETIYNVGEMSNTAATLAANGVKNYTEVTKSLGNLVAVAGGGAQAMSSASLALTQIVGAGKMYTGDWNQFINMIPGASKKIQDELKKNGAYTGDFRDAMSKGEITAKEFLKAINDLGNTKVAEKAATDTTKFSTAWQGMQEAVQDGIIKLMDTIGTKGLTDTISNLGNVGYDVFDGLAKWIKPLKPDFKTLGKIIDEIFSGAKDVFGTVGGYIGALTKSFRDSSSYAKPLNKTLKEIAGHSTGLKVLGGAIGSIVTSLLALRAIKTVVTIIKGLGLAFKALGTAMMTNPIGIVVVAVVALGVAFLTAYKHSKTFRDGVNKTVAKIKDWFSEALSAVKGFFADVGKFFTGQLGWEKAIGKEISKIVSTIGKTFNKIGSTLKKIGKAAILAFVYALALPVGIGITIMRPLVKGITSAISSLWPQVKKVWQAAWNGLVTVASAIWKPISKPVQAGLKLIQSLISTGLKAITKLWQREVEFWGTVISTVWNTIKKVVSAGMKALESVISPILKSISNVWSTTWNAISSFVGDVWNGISKTGKKIFGGIRDWMSDILDAISKKWSDVWNGLASAFSGIWDGIKGVAKSGWNAIIGFINTGVDGINSVIHFFGGKKDTVPKLKKLVHGTSANDRDELALVNDEGGDTYREAIVRTNGQVEIPKERNQLVFLNRGDEVIPAKRTAELFGLNRYATGKKGWLSAAWDNVKDWAGDTFEAIEDALKDPLGVLTDLFHKGKNTATDIWKTVGDGAADYLPKTGVEWFKKELQKLEDALTPPNPSGSGVERWRPYIEKAFKELHVTATEGKINKLLRQIQTESGGNPTIPQQISDNNSAAGHPAQGLLQFVPSTFNSWAVKDHHQILNGYDQILAAINCLEHGGEGGWGNVGNGHGWMNGGWADRPAIFGEVQGEPELAINPARQTADHYILEAIRARAAKSPNGFAAKLNQMIASQQQAGHQLVAATPATMPAPTLNNNVNNGTDLSGDVTITFQVDSSELARQTYPKYKMMKAQEIIIRNNGGAIPVGNAMPVGGGY